MIYIGIGVVLVVALFVALWVKAERERRELDRHSIEPDALYAVLKSEPSALILDVRQPLDLLAEAEMIPGARRVPSERDREDRRRNSQRPGRLRLLHLSQRQNQPRDDPARPRSQFHQGQIPPRRPHCMETKRLPRRTLHRDLPSRHRDLSAPDANSSARCNPFQPRLRTSSTVIL